MSYLNGITKNPGIIFAWEFFQKIPSLQTSSDGELLVLAEKFKPKSAADQLSELLFLARKTNLSRLTTFFASTATTLFS